MPLPSSFDENTIKNIKETILKEFNLSYQHDELIVLYYDEEVNEYVSLDNHSYEDFIRQQKKSLQIKTFDSKFKNKNIIDNNNSNSHFSVKKSYVSKSNIK